MDAGSDALMRDLMGHGMGQVMEHHGGDTSGEGVVRQQLQHTRAQQWLKTPRKDSQPANPTTDPHGTGDGGVVASTSTVDEPMHGLVGIHADDSETLYAHLQHELERFADQSLYVVMTSSKLSPILVKVGSDGCQEVGRLSLPETTLQPDEIYAVMINGELRKVEGRYLKFQVQERTTERVICFLVLILQIILSAAFTMSAHQFFRDEARVDISCPASGVLIGDTSYKIPLCPPPAPAIPYYQRIATVPLNANQYACIILVELFLSFG
jgi:hypothetical protein